MNDTPEARSPRRAWPQISLSTLLAFVLGIGVGLAVRRQFGAEAHHLPNPVAIRLGDKLSVEVGPGLNVPESKRTALVLADGTITLPKVGQVPAAGLSLDDLTADLKERYGIYYSQQYGTQAMQVPGSFPSILPWETEHQPLLGSRRQAPRPLSRVSASQS